MLLVQSPKLDTGTGELWNKRRNEDYQNRFIKIGQNTEKSPGDLRRLAVTQTPVRTHRLTLVWQTLKRVNNNNNHKCHGKQEGGIDSDKIIHTRGKNLKRYLKGRYNLTFSNHYNNDAIPLLILQMYRELKINKNTWED